MSSQLEVPEQPRNLPLQAVRAEILAAVTEEMENLSHMPLPDLVNLATEANSPYRSGIEANLRRHAAEILRTLEEIALIRGAGCPAGALLPGCD